MNRIKMKDSYQILKIRDNLHKICDSSLYGNYVLRQRPFHAEEIMLNIYTESDVYIWFWPTTKGVFVELHIGTVFGDVDDYFLITNEMFESLFLRNRKSKRHTKIYNKWKINI